MGACKFLQVIGMVMGSSDFSLVNISFIKKLCYWFEFGLFCDSKATFIWFWILFQSCEYFQHPFKHWTKKKMKSQKIIINDLSLGRCPKVGGAGARRLQNKNQAASDSDPRVSTLTKPTTWHKIHKLWQRKKTKCWSTGFWYQEFYQIYLYMMYILYIWRELTMEHEVPPLYSDLTFCKLYFWHSVNMLRKTIIDGAKSTYQFF